MKHGLASCRFPRHVPDDTLHLTRLTTFARALPAGTSITV